MLDAFLRVATPCRLTSSGSFANATATRFCVSTWAWSMSVPSLKKMQAEGRTIVDYLVSVVLRNTQVEWTDYVVGGVSDVDDAKTVYLIPSDMQLTLLEREVSKEAMHAALRTTIGGLLSRARIVFDVVLVDCPPGLSVLTECWLREADFHLSPTKPDYISVCGLDVFRRFRALNPEMGFAENLGVVVNMKDRASPADDEYHRWLAQNGVCSRREAEDLIARGRIFIDGKKAMTLRGPTVAADFQKIVVDYIEQRFGTQRTAAE